jgi:outer membrane protein assembly factor BamB
MQSRRSHRAWIVLAALVAATAAVAPAWSGDWTYWRGSLQNGTSTETGLVSTWSPEGENLIWKTEFIGRSTPVVVDGQVCVIGRVGEGVDRQEIVACYDAENGRKRWEDRFNVYNTTVPFNRVGWASLAADPETGIIYAHGVAGQLIAYDRNGKVVWSYFTTERFGRASGYGGRTQTPLVWGDLLILSYVSAGWGDQAAPRHRYFAFDKRTGDVVWVATPGRMVKDMNTQSVPVVAEIGGRTLLIGGAADGWIYAMKIDSGEKVWEFNLSKRGLNSSVVVEGARVFASHSEENLDAATMGRVVCIDGTGTGDITATGELWRIDELAAGFPTPAFKDGRLYIVDNSANLHAIDAATGKSFWTHNLGTVGKASPVWADGKLYVPETNGRFHILEPGDEACKTLDTDEITLADGRYAEIYGSPALAYGRVYLSTEAGLFCLGDKEAKFTITRAKTEKTKKKKKKGRSDPGAINVVPGDRLLSPGEIAQFDVKTLGGDGRFGDKLDAEWILEGLEGESDEWGRFVPSRDAGMQAGYVVAKVGDSRAKARVRVVPKFPWSLDFESFAEGETPATWINASKKFVVKEVDGNKVLSQPVRARGLQRSITYMGESDLTDYTVQVDGRGAQKGRRRTDIGVIAAGYTLDLMGNNQRLEIRTWPSERRIATAVDFPWEMDTWYRLKLSVDVDGDKAVVRGKAWKAADPEPEDWTITVEDPLPIAGGSPGLVGYAPAEILYDNFKVMVNQ